MDMEKLWDFCDLLEKQIDKALMKGDIDPDEMQSLYYAIKTKYYVYLMDKMEEGGDDFYDEESYANSYGGGSYRSGGGSYRGRSREGRSMARSGERYGRRSRMSMASRANGTSGHDDKEYMMQQIEEMKRQIDQM